MLALTLAIIIGAFVRITHVLGVDFPLNDGGFFYAMIRDLQNANYALPIHASYNLTAIPFAYPPLSLYAAGFLSAGLNLPLLDIIRVLPAVISILTIPAFFLLSRRILQSENHIGALGFRVEGGGGGGLQREVPKSQQVIFATFAFALLPTAFDWLIVGGGLTRSFGYLFAILTLYQAHALYTTSKKRHIFTTILFASLSILSHPGTAWFTVYSAGVLFLFYRRHSKAGLRKSLLVIAGVLAMTAPWWATLVNRYGLSVMLYPYQTESFSLASLLTPFTFLYTNEPLLDILAVTGLLGLLVCLRERAYLLPVWLVSVFIFEPRLGATYSVVPMAMLVGAGVYKVILPALSAPLTPQPWGEPYSPKVGGRGALPKIAFGYLLLYALISAYLAPNYNAVSNDQYKAMQWIEANTPEASQFVVVSGEEKYGIDYVAEWFPTLSRRSSLTTPQGHEWLPNHEFTRRVQAHTELQACANDDAACLKIWAERAGITFTHIYIPRYDSDCYAKECDQLEPSLKSSPNYDLIYEGAGGIIFAAKSTSP